MMPLVKSTAKDWDDVRSAFSTSIMVDTSLNSLAQNLDVPEWPVKGRDETPARYIDLDYEEVTELLQLKGQPPEVIDQLIHLLKETLAFDSPFGEMVEQAAAATERDNTLLKNLGKLNVPENFPIALTALEPGTLEFCTLEKLHTLGEFAVFAQTMSQTVIVGGDFKKLLNALSHVDEVSLAQVLPFRPGHKGLHLIEAVAHCSRHPDAAARVEIATTWFADDLAALEKELAAGQSIDRRFVVLGNPELEKRAIALLRPHLRVATTARAAAPAAKKRSGWLSWLWRK